MTKLPVVSGKDVVKALGKIGFSVVRQRGSHIRLKKVTVDRTIKLTVPLHSVVSKGTLKGIIGDAGLTVDEFVKLL